MDSLTQDEKAVLAHLAQDGRDLYARGYMDHQASLVRRRAGKEGGGLIARFASTANLNLATTGLTAIDGVTPVAGDIALVKNQSTPAQNGLYLVSAGAWTLLVDSSGGSVLKGGTLVSVAEGSAAAGKVYILGADLTTWSIQATTGVLATDLASNANNLGASLVGIEDALGLIAATKVESALAELVKYQTLALADPGTGVAIGVTRSAYVPLTIGSAGAETNTLAIPTFQGQRMVITADVVGTGTRAITSAQALNQAGNTIMTFAQVRDTISLMAITIGGALRWQVQSNDGVALS